MFSTGSMRISTVQTIRRATWRPGEGVGRQSFRQAFQIAPPRVVLRNHVSEKEFCFVGCFHPIQPIVGGAGLAALHPGTNDFQPSPALLRTRPLARLAKAPQYGRAPSYRRIQCGGENEFAGIPGRRARAAQAGRHPEDPIPRRFFCGRLYGRFRQPFFRNNAGPVASRLPEPAPRSHQYGYGWLFHRSRSPAF